MIEHGIQSILSSPVLPKLIEGKPEVPPKHSECHVHIYWFLIERIPRSLLRGYHLRTSLRNLGFLKFRIPLRCLVALLRGVSFEIQQFNHQKISLRTSMKELYD